MHDRTGRDSIEIRDTAETYGLDDESISETDECAVISELQKS